MAKPLVLILEDDIALSMDWSATLRDAGFDIRAAVDVAEADTLIRDHKFDLVIVDSFIREETGLSSEGGLTVISALRRPPLRNYPEWGRDVPILAVTGATEAFGFDPLNIAESIGANHRLRKPIAPQDLIATCQQLLIDTNAPS